MTLLWPAFRTFAEDEPVDIENAITPTSLADLLPEDGIDSVNVDYWMTMKMLDENGRVVGNPSYLQWSIKPVDGKLVFTHRVGHGGPNGFNQVRRTIYTVDGRLVSYRDVYHRNNGMLRIITGKIDGDMLVLETARDLKGKNPKPTGDSRRIPLKLFDDALPGEFVPLVLAYHIRNGSLGYAYKTIDVASNNQIIETRVEDLGVEKVEVDGKMVRAHFLKAEKNYLGKRPRVRTVRMLVLEDGAAMNMDARENSIRLSYIRGTEADIAKRFNIDVDEFIEKK